MDRSFLYRENRYVSSAYRILESLRRPQVLTGIVSFILFVSLVDVSNLTSYLRGNGDGKYHGRYPNSLLTLFFPYTLLRDVVLDQPVSPTDVPFFWHIHKSDEIIMKQILTECYGLALVELDTLESIQKAKEVNLASRKANNFVVTSPFIREAVQIFTPDNFGRMFCFFRHPLDYDVHDNLPTFPSKDNWLTRMLSDVHEDPLGYKQLGIAKHVVRETCVVGTLDKMAASIKRMGQYYGWELVASESCIDDAVARNNPREKWLDHDSQEWEDFYKDNKMDCQLYELAQSTWRAQIQTIIPYEIQMKRIEGKD